MSKQPHPHQFGSTAMHNAGVQHVKNGQRPALNLPADGRSRQQPGGSALAGAAVGGAIGGALGGPVGMVAGALLGAFFSK
jgi:hypothetical protein